MGGGEYQSVGLMRREGVGSIDMGVVRYIAAPDQMKMGDPSRLLRKFL